MVDHGRPRDPYYTVYSKRCLAHVHSRLHETSVRLPFYRCNMSTTEEKLDSILKLLADIKQEHADGQRDLRPKLEKLEKEVATGQEDATQQVVKQLKEDRTLVFKKKGNERQFLFNNNVKDQMMPLGNTWICWSCRPKRRGKLYRVQRKN